jgi:hypothetical protein
VATTPWWVWVGGAIVAVAIGVSAALWYAERSKDAPAPPTATALAQPAPSTAPATPAVQPIVEPTAQPIVEPAAQPVAPPVAHGTVIEVRFDSLPSGGVYATGRSTELCRTPCAFNIDLADGGPTDHRDFVVKRDGYADGPLTVDLTADKREFQVMLAQVAPAAPHDSRPLDAQADPKRDKRPTKRTLKVTGRDGKAGKANHDAPDARDARDAKDPDHDHLLDPNDGQAAPAKKPPTKPAIDPSDTLDPFRPKP